MSNEYSKPGDSFLERLANGGPSQPVDNKPGGQAMNTCGDCPWTWTEQQPISCIACSMLAAAELQRGFMVAHYLDRAQGAEALLVLETEFYNAMMKQRDQLHSELARVREEVPCGRCLGTGKDHPFRIESEPYPKCPDCQGTGKKYPEAKP